MEISYGEWDGQANADLKQRYPKAFSKFTGKVIPEYAELANGETFEHVEKRVRSFITDITKRYPNDRILVVTHGFTARSFATNAVHAMGQDILPPTNCSVTKITVEPTTIVQHLIYYNRTVQGF